MSAERKWPWQFLRPFVLRRNYDRLGAKYDRQVQTLKERDRALSRLGHTVEETKREHAKLLSDLRLIRVQIEYPSPASDKIGFTFQMHGSIFDGFRHDQRFVDLLAYMVEGQMRQTPEGRETLAGLYMGGLL